MPASTTDLAYLETLARLKKPSGPITDAKAALKAFDLLRKYQGLGFNAYHTYQTRNPGTATANTALGKSDAYNAVASMWSDAIRAYLAHKAGA